MNELDQRISEFIAKREKATPGEWAAERPRVVIRVRNNVGMFVCDSVVGFADAEFITAAANDAVPLLLACQEKIRELELQATFEQAFADKLKELGTIDRLIEEYSASKMKARGLESQLAETQAALAAAYSQRDERQID